MEDIFMLRRPTSAPGDLVILQSTMLDALRRHNSDVEHRIGTGTEICGTPDATSGSSRSGPTNAKKSPPECLLYAFFGSFAVPRV